MSIFIQQMCGNGATANGGQQGENVVRSWNGITAGADGNIRATADDLGAALASLNIRTITKAYRRYIAIEGHEETTPMGFLWGRGKGSYFLRAEDGIHFVSCVDVASGLKARLYVNIPSPQEEEPEQNPGESGGLLLGSSGDGEPEGPHIRGGVYLNNTPLAGITSPDDLSRLIFLLGESPITTAADIEAAVRGLVTQEELETDLQTAISDIWGNVTDGWEASEQRSSIPEGSSAMHYMRTYLQTIEEDGRYYIESELGKAYMHRETVGVNVYTWFWLMPAAATDKLNFEYWLNDHRILGTSSGDGILRLDILGKQVLYKDEFLSAMAGVPSRESVSAEMAQKVNEVTQTYNSLSVIRTRLQKFKGTPQTIRVEIENAHMLYDEEDVILQLWVCSRKHGTAHHWWHPSQPGSPTKTSPIGYAMIAGDLIYQNRPLETARFPAVPAWMPNNGYVLTEIQVTHQDLVNGYVDIDCSTYFLPFVKPRGTTWKYKEVVMMFTQRKPGTDKRYSVPVTWKVGVLRDGTYQTVGSSDNIAKIGFRRYENDYLVDIRSKKKTLKNLHISIK